MFILFRTMFLSYIIPLLIYRSTAFSLFDSIFGKQECNLKNDFELFLIDNNTNARCIDGTPAGYYIRPGSGDGINKWSIHFEGGGWCYSLSSCIQRSETVLGSSKDYPKCQLNKAFHHYESTNKHLNPMLYNWNMVRVKYCDGTSFAGDAIKQHEVREHIVYCILAIVHTRIHLSYYLTSFFCNRIRRTISSVAVSGRRHWTTYAPIMA